MGQRIEIKIEFLDEASEYLESLPAPVLKKMLHNIKRISGGEINTELFKKLNKDIWEFRVKMLKMSYRLLAFWDKDTKSLIIATHGFNKKTQKTPASEIAHATEIMNEYYNQNYQK